MSQLFARVELLGSPTFDVYEKLHAYMLSKFWYQQINGFDLPHAMYQATGIADEPDLLPMANALKADIQAKIWTKALIFIVRSADWAKTAAG